MCAQPYHYRTATFCTKKDPQNSSKNHGLPFVRGPPSFTQTSSGMSLSVIAASTIDCKEKVDEFVLYMDSNSLFHDQSENGFFEATSEDLSPTQENINRWHHHLPDLKMMAIYITNLFLELNESMINRGLPKRWRGVFTSEMTCLLYIKHVFFAIIRCLRQGIIKQMTLVYSVFRDELHSLTCLKWGIQ